MRLPWAITSVGFATTGGALDGFDQLQQPRISFAGATATPEPSTLLLGSLAVLGGAGARWRKRRKAD
jgi:hypothetical protein